MGVVVRHGRAETLSAEGTDGRFAISSTVCRSGRWVNETLCCGTCEMRREPAWTERRTPGGLCVRDALIQTSCDPAGDPARDLLALREEDPFREDGGEVQKVPRGGSSRVQTQTDGQLLSRRFGAAGGRVLEEEEEESAEMSREAD